MKTNSQISPLESRPIPERFKASKATLLIDRLMTGTIISGGFMVILSVLGIMLFIFLESVPLFRGAQISPITTVPHYVTATLAPDAPTPPDVSKLAKDQGVHIDQTAISYEGNHLALSTSDHKILYFLYDDDESEWIYQQTIDSPLHGENPTLLGWVFGGNSLVVGGENGQAAVYSIFPQKTPQGKKAHLLGKTKDLDSVKGKLQFFLRSTHNRLFIIGSDSEIHLCYSTTGDTRLKKQNFTSPIIQIEGNNDLSQITLTDQQGNNHSFEIKDPHPEAGLASFFSKLQYEGYSTKEWQWQSVGGTDDYEAKLSLVPLIFGTIKGTLYALLFAVPIALTAAIYTAHFMPASSKKVIKPVMEIMASLPSVVLGFFGALYIAPLFETKVSSLLCMAILLPLLTLVAGKLWLSLPITLRNKLNWGIEYIVAIPLSLFTIWICWSYLGDWIEPYLVRPLAYASGMSSPQSVDTFADLWRSGFGLAYEQRNSLIVGFIMGFAVIPVIFTIAEDALSNVPPALVHGAEALGASRWQILRTIILPIASAGIFSALMIGLGRAVGETMIVLMATGNTPIMDWNIFNGMRTLSANIATELPEAAEHSTHYRVLFLSGFLLFVLTFVINTLAEYLRNKLRNKYKVI